VDAAAAIDGGIVLGVLKSTTNALPSVGRPQLLENGLGSWGALRVKRREGLTRRYPKLELQCECFTPTHGETGPQLDDEIISVLGGSVIAHQSEVTDAPFVACPNGSRQIGDLLGPDGLRALVAPNL